MTNKKRNLQANKTRKGTTMYLTITQPNQKRKKIDEVVANDTTKRLMSFLKCKSVEVINNPARPGSKHKEVNCINYK